MRTIPSTRLRYALAGVLALLAASGFHAVLTAQGAPPAASAGAQTSSASGIPNLSGVYNIRDFRLTMENMGLDLPGGRIPLLPERDAQYRDIAKRQLSNTNPETDQSPSAHCLPPGISFLMTAPYAMEIIQTPTKVLVLQEFGNFLRQIFLNRPNHGDPDPTWLGHSIGRYEGDTLVVDTVGFNGKAWLDLSGLRATDGLHTVERFRIVNGELEWTITFDDPNVFTRPWSVRTHYRPVRGFDINEYVCLENNTLLGSPGMKVEPLK